MKWFLIFSLGFMSMFAQANTTVLNCLSDRRAVDGALEKLEIVKSLGQGYKFMLLSESSGMLGPSKHEVNVSSSNCEFSTVTPGIGECIETTSDGFRGKNRLTIVLGFRDGKEQLRALNYLMGSDYRETLSQEINFDLSTCKLSK